MKRDVRYGNTPYSPVNPTGREDGGEGRSSSRGRNERTPPSDNRGNKGGGRRDGLCFHDSKG